MTCKDCIHYCLCKDTLADENWREDTPQEIKDMYSPNGCENFKNKANFVEVVRCKDCVYWECRGYDGRCEAYHNGLIRDYTNYDDFCSYGEKRSEEE